MSYSIVIPARYQSQRLPGKPLLDIAGKSMIERVYEQVQHCSAERVVIATDDQRIEACVKGFGGDCVMTSDQHESGTDRLSEVATLLAMEDDHIVVNVQGDEPEVPAIIVDQVADNLAKSAGFAIATLGAPIHDVSELFDENAVKAVHDISGRALYFSRAAIPWQRGEFTYDSEQIKKSDLPPHYLRHIGIYAYRVEFLKAFSQLSVCPLEKIERLEQLRAMWYGYSIHIDTAKVIPPAGIDTVQDLERVRKKLSHG